MLYFIKLEGLTSDIVKIDPVLMLSSAALYEVDPKQLGKILFTSSSIIS